MLPGDTFVSKLSISECLNAIEFALTDSQISYQPYGWQVYSSDSRKGRLTAIAKSKVQGEEYPSFSVSFELKLQPDKLTTISWSYDAPVRCSAIAETTNAAVLNHLVYVQDKPAEAKPSAKVPVREPSREMEPAGKLAPKAVPGQSVRDVAPIELAKKDAGAVLGSIPALRPNVGSPAPAVSATTGGVSPGAVSPQPKRTDASASKPGGWLRHFVLGDCCPDCGGGKVLGANQHCSSDYHQ
ncbi:MAG: hypothetical protein K2W95_03255 [Candidatus Obscuribacterales bacterium]|nr:hypothetical protein [Candidatus Obscuribacterales bacterium]